MKNKKTPDCLINNISKKSERKILGIILFKPRTVDTTIVFIITITSCIDIRSYKPTYLSKLSFISLTFLSNFFGTVREFPAILRLIFFGCSHHMEISNNIFNFNIFGCFQNKKTSDYLICNFFFLPIARNPIPKTPINIIIPLSNIFSAIGLSVSIKTTKRGIAEIIINIIPLISYPFNFVSNFFSPLNKYPIKVINIFGGFQ